MNITHALTIFVSVSRRVALGLSKLIRARQLFSNGFKQTWRFARMVCVAGIVVAGCQGGSSGRGTFVADNLPNPSADGIILSGTAMGGRQPIAGSKIYVYAAKSTAGTDAVQIDTATTNKAGGFNFDNFTTAPTNGDLIYMVSAGGDAGGGTNGTALLLAVVGKATVTGSGAAQTISLSHSSAIINEFTTAVALSKLKANITLVPSEVITNNTRTGICPDIKGVAAGWAATATAIDGLVDVPSGLASSTLTGAAANSAGNKNLLVLNLEASVLANCINSKGGKHGDATACGNLLDNAIASKGTSVGGLTYMGAYGPANEFTTPTKVAITANGRFLYVINFDGAAGVGQGTKINGYSIKLDGSLAPITGSPFTATGSNSVGLNDLVITPDNKYLYASLSGKALGSKPAKVWGFSIDQSTGALSTIGTNGEQLSFTGSGQLPGYPLKLAVDPSSKNVAVAANTGFGFASISATGALTYLGAPAGTSITALTSSNKYSAVTMVATNIAAANLTKGTLTNMPGATVFITTNNNPTPPATPPASTTDNLVCDANTKCYNLGAGRNVTGAAMTSDGKFMFAANANYNTISLFKTGSGTFSTGSGLTLVSVPNAITSAAANTMVSVTTSCNSTSSLMLSPDNKFLFVTCVGGNTVATSPVNGTGDAVSVYSVDPATGLLTEVNTGARAFTNKTGTGGTAQKPTSLALVPGGRFAYATLSAANALAIFSVGATDSLSGLYQFAGSGTAADATKLFALKPPAASAVYTPLPATAPTTLALQ